MRRFTDVGSPMGQGIPSYRRAAQSPGAFAPSISLPGMSVRERISPLLEGLAAGGGAGEFGSGNRRMPAFAAAVDAGLLHHVSRREYELGAPMRAFLQTDEAAEIASRRIHQLLGL